MFFCDETIGGNVFRSMNDRENVNLATAEFFVCKVKYRKIEIEINKQQIRYYCIESVKCKAREATVCEAV